MPRTFSTRLAVLLVALSGAAASAQVGAVKNVVLNSGDALFGVTILAENDTTIRFTHPVLGEITIPRDRIASMVDPPPPPAPGAEPAVAPAPAAPPAPESAAAPAEELTEEKSPWTGSLELGVAGSEGNTENANIRAAAGLKRETEKAVFELGSRYKLRTDRGDRTENQWYSFVRHEWYFIPTPWGAFVEADHELNEFQDWDSRLGLRGGFTYRFIKNDTTELKGRIGLGASREFGGSNDEWTPEGVLGLRFNHKFNDRVEFLAYGDYYPDLSEISEFRVVSGAAIQVALNESKSLALKAGVEDRYESDPGNAEPHDFDYFITLLYSF